MATSTTADKTFMVYNMRSQQQMWGAVGGQKK
jgi:hypothetical protein